MFNRTELFIIAYNYYYFGLVITVTGLPVESPTVVGHAVET